MLFYNPPFLMVDTLTAFPDHSDPETFYYLVSVPELVREGNAPAFHAVVVLPDGAAANMADRVSLSFDIQLAASPEALANLTKELAKRTGRQVRRLLPAPMHAGKASLVIASPGGEPGSKDLFVYSGHPPSLVGDNRTVFTITARAEEAKILVATMSAGQIPAVVSYELEFLGLSPSFQARMVVHWDAAYRYFREHTSHNYILYSHEVDETVERFQEQRIIVIEVMELDPDGAKGATKALLDELKSQVIQKLFCPPRDVGDTAIEERIGRGVRDIVTAVLPGSAYSLRQVDQSALSDTTIDLREQQVKSHMFFPQSTLSGLLRRAGGIEGRLKWVKLGELPNRQEELLIELAGDAARLGVRSVDLLVQVRSASPDRLILEKLVSIDPLKPERQVLPFRRDGMAEPIVRYRAFMALDSSVNSDSRERWSCDDWRPVEALRLRFDPEEWLDLVELKFEIDDPGIFDPPTRAKVALDLSASMPGCARPFRHVYWEFGKDQDSRAKSFAVVVPQGAVPVFSATEVFIRPGEPEYRRELSTIECPVHRIMNPFWSWSMTIRAVSTSHWSATAELAVELRVRDVARKRWIRDAHTFTQADPSYTFSPCVSLETPQRAEARVTRIAADQQVVRGPWQDLAGPIAAISDEVQALRRIRVTLHAPQYQELHLPRYPYVTLKYVTQDHEYSSDPLPLKGDGAVADWTHPFSDPNLGEYSYVLSAVGESGERYCLRGKQTQEDLELALPEKPW